MLSAAQPGFPGISAAPTPASHHLGTPLPAGVSKRIGIPFPVDAGPSPPQLAKARGGTEHDRLVECAGWLFVTPVEVDAIVTGRIEPVCVTAMLELGVCTAILGA